MDHEHKKLILSALNGKDDVVIADHIFALPEVEFVEATTAKEVLKLCSKQEFDCIIVDFDIPGCDGASLIHQLRSQGCDSAIVAIPNEMSETTVRDIFKNGAQDYIPPDLLNTESLLKTVSGAILLKQAANESQYYKDFYDHAPVGFYTTRIDDGSFIKANDFLVDLLGCSSFEELSENYKSSDFYPIKQRKKLLRLLKTTGYVTDFELEITLPDGTKRWVILTARRCRQGECLEGSVTDISERKALEYELQTYQEKELKILQELQRDANKRIMIYERASA